MVWLQAPIGIKIPVQQVFNPALAFGLQLVSQAEAHDILTVDRINGIVIGIFNWQQAQARQFVIELRQLVGRVRGRRDKNVIDRWLKNVAQAVHIKKRVLEAGPDARGFKRNLSASIEHSAIHLISRGAIPRGFAVVSETAPDPRRDIEPAEKRLGQQQLMKRIGAGRGKISRRR